MTTARDIFFVLKAKDEASKVFKENAQVIRQTGDAAKKFANDNQHLVQGARLASGAMNLLKNSLIAGAAAFSISSLAAATGIGKYIEFERGLINVAKTVGLSKKEMFEFGKAVTEMSLRMPYTTSQLNNIAEIAGQLGIQGSANITKFTEAIAEFSSAAPSLDPATAAETLARISTLTNEPIENIRNVSSAIVQLGNDLNGSERDITDIAVDVAQRSASFGLTAKQVVALSGTLANFGARAELSGSAIARTFGILQETTSTGGKNLELLSKITGKTGEELKKQFSESSFDSLDGLLSGLSRLDKESRAGAMRQLGLDSIGTGTIVGLLAEKYSTFGGVVDKVNFSYQEGTAATIEAQKAYDSLKSQIQITSNAFSAMMTEAGSIFAPLVKSLAQDLRDVFVKVKEQITAVKEALPSLGESLLDISKIVVSIGVGAGVFMGIRAAMMAWNTASILLNANLLLSLIRTRALYAMQVLYAGLMSGNFFRLAVAGFMAIANALKSAAFWQGILNAVMAANPIAIVVGALAAAGTALYLFRDKTITVGNTTAKVGDFIIEIWTRVKNTILNAGDSILINLLNVKESLMGLSETQAKMLSDAKDRFASRDDLFSGEFGKIAQARIDAEVSALIKGGAKVEDAIRQVYKGVQSNAVNVPLNPPIEGTGTGGGGGGTSLNTEDPEVSKTKEKADAYKNLLKQKMDNLKTTYDQIEATKLVLNGEAANIEAAKLLLEVKRSQTAEERNLSQEQIRAKAVLDEVNSKLEQRNQLTDSFGDIGSSALKDLIKGAKSFNEVLADMASQLADVFLQMALIEPLKKSISSSGGGAGGFFSAVGSFFGLAQGGAVRAGNIIPFAKGGVVDKPTFFPMNNGNTGVYGEAGTEGIFPLTRTPSGDLGVKAVGGGSTTVNYSPSFSFTMGQDNKSNQGSKESQGQFLKILDNEVRRVVIEVISKEQRIGGSLNRGVSV